MEVNLTPMIDCTFQLIIFFIIVAQISDEQLAPMIVPEPEKSRAVTPDQEKGKPDVVIVNVWTAFEDKEKLKDGTTRNNEPILAMRAEGYKIRKEKIEVGNLQRLTEILKEEKARFEAKKGTEQTFYVEVRADRDIGYDEVLPVMRAAAEAGIARMYMTAIADPHYKAS